MPSAQTRSCALPCDGVDACPPGAASCFSCAYWREAGAPAEEAAGRAEDAAHERARVVDHLRPWGLSGSTAEQVAQGTGLPERRARARLAELEREGVVRRRNARRRTHAGGRAAIFVLATPAPRRSDAAP